MGRFSAQMSKPGRDGPEEVAQGGRTGLRGYLGGLEGQNKFMQGFWVCWVAQFPAEVCSKRGRPSRRPDTDETGLEMGRVSPRPPVEYFCEAVQIKVKGRGLVPQQTKLLISPPPWVPRQHGGVSS